MSKLMVVDCHSLGHSAKHATKRLSFGGRKTGVMYGFLRKLLTLAEDIAPDQIVFAWDSPDPTCKRKEIRKSYKSSRADMNDEDKMLQKIALAQFHFLRTIWLPELGFQNIFSFDGYEADDLIAVITLENHEDECVMVARDHDLFQLLTDNCSMLDHVTSSLMTAKLFKERWSIEPKLWPSVKAIAGCKTDDVEGVKGIGDKTAIDILTGANRKGAKYRRVRDNMKLIIDNLKLVHLPFDGQLFNKMRLDDNEVTRDKFVYVCSELGFKSMLNKRYIERWLSAFGQT